MHSILDDAQIQDKHMGKHQNYLLMKSELYRNNFDYN